MEVFEYWIKMKTSSIFYGCLNSLKEEKTYIINIRSCLKSAGFEPILRKLKTL